MNQDRIEKLLESVGCRKIKTRFKNVTATCPNEKVHSNGVDRNPSFSVIINNSGWSYCKCFTCGFEGFLEKLAVEWGFEEYGGNLQGGFKKRLDSLNCDRNANLKHWGKSYDDGYYDFLPEYSIKPFLGSCPRYIIKRGISIESAKRWNIGYDKENKRAIFIIRDKEKRLCGVSGRSIIDRDPKYTHYSWDIKNYKLEPFIDHDREGDFQRFRKSNFLFGEHLVDYSRGDIVLVEGHLDAVKVDQCGYNAVALMGTQFNKNQIKRIKELIPSGTFAVLMLDGDKAGRDATKKLESELEGVLVKKVALPDNTDPGDFSGNKLKDFLSVATIF